jgi:hypothetical protein
MLRHNPPSPTSSNETFLKKKEKGELVSVWQEIPMHLPPPCRVISISFYIYSTAAAAAAGIS